jgi:hypothetical protein
MPYTQFQIEGSDQNTLSHFFQAVQAVDTSLEWGWNRAVIGHEDDPPLCMGFGFTPWTVTELQGLAHRKGIDLVYVEEDIDPSHIDFSEEYVCQK